MGSALDHANGFVSARRRIKPTFPLRLSESAITLYSKPFKTVLRTLRRLLTPGNRTASDRNATNTIPSQTNEEESNPPITELSEYEEVEPLPRYSPKDIHGVAALDEILSATSAILARNNAELASQPSKLAIERLRNFLLYTLTIDHVAKLEGIYLSSADADLYLELDAFLQCLDQAWEVVWPDMLHKQTIGAYLLHHIHAPARALGLPFDLVILAIQRFRHHQSDLYVYKGRLAGVWNSHSPTSLAGKFYNDRKIVIPTVAPDTETRKALLESLQKFQDTYFKYVNGPSCITTVSPKEILPTELGFVDLASVPINLGCYELTDSVKKYVLSRTQGAKAIPSSRQVQECLEELVERRNEEVKRVEAGRAGLTAPPEKTILFALGDPEGEIQFKIGM